MEINYRYSRDEKVDILLIYGECQKNAMMACNLYTQRYPDRHHPSRNYFSRVEQQFRREPNVEDEERFIINEDTEITVLAYVEAHPTTSVREIENECGVNRETARRILKKHEFKPYKYHCHQHLYENDNERRVNYCNWLIDNHLADINFHTNILFSDETRFTNNGMFNRNNTRYWARENPHLVRQGNFQERFGFNVWMGILGNRIVGPIFFDGQLNGQRYLNFLQNDVEEFLDNLPIENLRLVHFQQDGAPPHNSRAVTDYLQIRFGNRWIGTNGPVRWPARSPDLTPLDFFAWGHVKDQVYSTPPTTLEDLQNRVSRAIDSITPAQLNNVMRKLLERAVLCRDLNGQHFEQFL